MQLTVREAAKFLNVSEKTVYRWASQGEIPLYRVNGQYRFNKTELLEWANARNLAVSVESFGPRAGAPAGAVVEALRAGGVHYDLPGTDKASALRAVVNALPVGDKSESDALYEILLAKEAGGTTAIGNGIAIPHVRNPIVLNVASPVISLCFLKSPVDFGARDGRPVHTLFWLITPSVPVHLHVLSRLAYLLRDEGFAAALARRASAEDILREAGRVEASLSPRAAP